MIKISDIKVERLYSMGDDLMVINCARVTLDKWHEQFEKMSDTRLINFLSRENHWEPFAHPHMTIRVTAPIFVARQLQKHRVGFAWSEVSRRYVDYKPSYYLPELRRRAAGVKQGSMEEEVKSILDSDGFEIAGNELVKRMFSLSDQCYERLLESDVAPEVARSVLPQSMMTTWIWTGSLIGFIRVCTLRLDPHAQKETQIVAQDIYKFARELFPISVDAWLKK